MILFWPKGDLNNGNTSRHPFLRSSFHSLSQQSCLGRPHLKPCVLGRQGGAGRSGLWVCSRHVAAVSPPVPSLQSPRSPEVLGLAQCWAEQSREEPGREEPHGVLKIAAVTHSTLLPQCASLRPTGDSSDNRTR